MINIKQVVSDDACWVRREAWASQAVYELEKAAIFGRSWLFLGHESQIPKPNDFVQAYMGETPIILSRDEQGSVHALVNSCSHRGLPVCRSSHGNSKRFICPYHNWSYASNGDLVAIPQEKHLPGSCAEKAKLGLKPVPRVEQWRGFVFGCFDAEVEPLESHLGDMRFYLEAFLDRFPGGIEFMGSPQRWVVDANWKLPVENQLGDVNHGPFLHSGVIPPEANAEVFDLGLSAVTAPGHGATFRLMPEDAPVEQVAWGFESIVGQLGGDELQGYLRDIQAQASDRVGPLRARMKGLTYGVWPNLSFLWSNAAFKVSHPRGPGRVEYWSWSVVPADAPPELKRKLRANHTSFFGPGGILEQEDSEAWMQQFKGANIDYMQDRPFYYGLGLGEESEREDLPGKVGVTANEHYARGFYARWRDALAAEQERRSVGEGES